MKSMRFDGHLLVTDITITYSGRKVKLKNVVVSTSEASTSINIHSLESEGIPVHDKEAAEQGLVVDSISAGPLKVINFPVAVARFTEGDGADGILGMDFLKKVGAKINLDSMTLSGSRIL
ncbi:aspartyl protease family protein [Evansella clarkii]|uniref:aspartyl protease family protein n=1 Tax=Evansella clarkii TaxID=79879 RepID=UPI000B430921|nr:aspartyl protease family protein [Evansella clarkii]